MIKEDEIANIKLDSISVEVSIPSKSILKPSSKIQERLIPHPVSPEEIIPKIKEEIRNVEITTIETKNLTPMSPEAKAPEVQKWTNNKLIEEVKNDKEQKSLESQPSNKSTSPKHKLEAKIIVPEVLPKGVDKSPQKQSTKSFPKPALLKADQLPPGAKPNNENYLQQALSFEHHNGIDLSPEFIDYFLELLFINVIGPSKDNFLLQINTPLPKDLLLILKKTRCNDSSPILNQCGQIIPTEVEKRISQGILLEMQGSKSIRKCQEIYNRAVCAATNEALDMLRPYGLYGDPSPWSNQQRILFKDIVDTELIVKNVKSMVIFLFIIDC